MLITVLIALLLSTTPDSAIRAARAQSNKAIAAHDVAGTVAIMHPAYMSVSSTNTRTVGRDAASENYTGLFATRAGVVFVRTPTAVTVNKQWGQAGESGRWTGKWAGADGAIRVGGIYFAKWLLVNGEWKLYAETFVQTSCEAKKFCDAAPAIP